MEREVLQKSENRNARARAELAALLIVLTRGVIDALRMTAPLPRVAQLRTTIAPAR